MVGKRIELTLSGHCKFSGGTIRLGRKMIMNTKKLIKLAVSTFAELGSVFLRCTKLGPMIAPKMILIA